MERHVDALPPLLDRFENEDVKSFLYFITCTRRVFLLAFRIQYHASQGTRDSASVRSFFIARE